MKTALAIIGGVTLTLLAFEGMYQIEKMLGTLPQF